jgi:hypothetical protein
MIELVELADLDSLYGFLEEKAIDYTHYDIANFFRKMHDKMHTEKNASATKAQWEMYVFDFSFAGNTVTPVCTLAGNKGKLVSYPDYDSFGSQAYDYIAKRMNSTNNPLLKTQYAHFLWLSQKHGNYAELAIDNYLLLVKLYEQKNKDNPQKHFSSAIVEVVKNAFLLSKNIKNSPKLDLAKSEIKRLFFCFNAENTCLYMVRVALLKLMINEKKCFRKADFDGIADICFNFSKSLNDPAHAISILKLGERIEQKSGVPNHSWNEQLAISYEKLMKTFLRNNKHIAINFSLKALKYYKLVENLSKIRELEGIYTELSKSRELPDFEIHTDCTKYITDCESTVKKLMELPSEDIFGSIMVDKKLLPDFQRMKEVTQKSAENKLLRIFPSYFIDEQGHINQHFTSSAEKEFFQTILLYHNYFDIYYSFFLKKVFIDGLRANKITYEALIDFFQKYCWFGKTIYKKRYNKKIQYNWLNLLSPSLFEYFTQINYWRVSKNYPNLLLCIDSLTLKIEGLLRDLFYFKGIATFASKMDKGHMVTYEKDLNALLDDERTSELFDSNDLFLFKFVLIEKAGYNLRNRIAHSLMLNDEYTIRYIHLLVLLLLKLGSLQLDSNEKKMKLKEKIP